jgi:hypothetical protein
LKALRWARKRATHVHRNSDPCSATANLTKYNGLAASEHQSSKALRKLEIEASDLTQENVKPYSSLLQQDSSSERWRSKLEGWVRSLKVKAAKSEL